MNLDTFLGISIWSIVKIFVMFANLIYIVFALVMVRQVKLMTDTLELGYEKIIIGFSYVNLTFAILVIIYSFLTL
ncbi:hypothetical protein A2W13_01130 [Candidatus Woesebacteria bacterium RBG_16_36_11]|uniref:Uncharacterized protein n=3 Tax=Candidatus Woeseibacteriota TaxID=1752722 RepID=A0A1F7XBT9_9BACT|nr:MAG: hypothetical protein A2Z67_03135 [Candidatus Woesebacteria bacterium RBG_13_36_22]OGM12229.1 MAG: hypothetical protein A2W13_01130 [Candidatus Woesebacteria bacterium RBG_16_36_11]OGM16172.1 MAG: hypothetical protein A2V55_01390 [Candidatus Woesebacteria bacterium RBG_19FT_COMBO_37_29]